MIERDWCGLYSDGWKGEITDESFSHPAKFSRGLIWRIYEHCLEQGYFKPGDVVLDSFGGVGLGAKDAIQNGLYWVGVELEQPFNDLGAGCDCTGISKADWARFYGRWDRARYLNGRHWCPSCLSQAKIILNEIPEPNISQAQAIRRRRIKELAEKKKQHVQVYKRLPLSSPLSTTEQLSFVDEVKTTSYKRNSGKIPHTKSHHYTGNIELWCNDGSAVLLQGDSRYLVQVLGDRLGDNLGDGFVSSPPYSKTHIDRISPGGRVGDNYQQGIKEYYSHDHSTEQYSNNPANLGNLPEGDHERTVNFLSSPPYAGDVGHDAGCVRLDEAEDKRRVMEGAARRPGYGTTPGQLGAMRVVSSAPYAGSLASDDPDKRGGLYRDEKRRTDKTLTAEYGESEGQLGAMKVVSSPPYEGSMSNETNGIDWSKCKPDYPGRQFHKSRISMLDRNHSERCYGSGAENIGNSTGDDFWTAARQIMQQVAMLLPPGACAVWVCKRFVKDKQIVEFSRQWAALGEACGFETIEWIRAWLIEDRGAQYDLFGGLEERQVARKSFFRRLYESKYPENSIDWEDIIIQRRVDHST